MFLVKLNDGRLVRKHIDQIRIRYTEDEQVEPDGQEIQNPDVSLDIPLAIQGGDVIIPEEEPAIVQNESIPDIHNSGHDQNKSLPDNNPTMRILRRSARVSRQPKRLGYEPK